MIAPLFLFPFFPQILLALDGNFCYNYLRFDEEIAMALWSGDSNVSCGCAEEAIRAHVRTQHCRELRVQPTKNLHLALNSETLIILSIEAENRKVYK